MIKISKPLSVGKVSTYFEKEFTSNQEAYYTDKGQVIGMWHGKEAEAFGLTGPVDKAHYDRLANGQHPFTAEQLVKHRDSIKTREGKEVGHRSAWDMTVSAPKSYSLTALVGGDQRLREAHRQALKSALDAAQEYTQARGGGNRAPITTKRWAAALFEHDTARPVDGYPAPQLHTHVVIFNLTKADQYRSLDPRELFKIQSYTKAVYYAELAKRARALGYELEAGKGYAPEIKGYSAEYRKAMSARSELINAQMKDKGIGGAEAAERIAHQSREAKVQWDAETLRKRHLEEAAKYRQDPVGIVAQAEGRAREITVSEEQRQQYAAQALRFARHRLEERTAVFDHFELMRDALHYGQGTLTLPDVSRSFESNLNSGKGEYVEVNHYRAHAPGARYTTPQMLRMERSLLSFVDQGRERFKPFLPDHVTKDWFRVEYGEQIIDGKRKGLNGTQMNLAWDILHSRDQVMGIQGAAGAGKTTALRPIAQLIEKAGYETHGLATTSGAARELAEAGINTETMQSFLIRGAKEHAKPRVYFVDESSLVDTRQLSDFVDYLQNNAPRDRLVLVGDRRQHQAVGPGRIFEELQIGGMETRHLNYIVRQQNENARKVVKMFARGQTKDAVAELASQKKITQIMNREQRFRSIARTYAANPESTLVVSPDNESRKDINATIREQLRQYRKIGEDKVAVLVMVPRQNMTAADRRFAPAYEVGNVIRFQQSSKELGIQGGDYVTVQGIDRDRGRLTVCHKSSGTVSTFDPSKIKAPVQVYEPEERRFALGDRIQFTNPWKEKRIANRATGEIIALNSDGQARVRLDKDQREIRLDLKTMPHVDYGYAMTSYSAQGTTVDRVLIHVEGLNSQTRALTDKVLGYVAASRARHEIRVFTDDQEELAKALNRLALKPKALAVEQIREYRREQGREMAIGA